MKTMKQALKQKFSNYGRFMISIDFEEYAWDETGLKRFGGYGTSYLGDYDETLEEVFKALEEKFNNSKYEIDLKIKAEMKRMGFKSLLDLEADTGSRNRRYDDIKHITLKGNYKVYETPDFILKNL